MGSFFEKLKSLGDELCNQVKQFQNKTFMKAVTAGCALIAAADGSIDASEKVKMAGFVKRNEALKVFPMNDVIKSFNTFAEGFDLDFTIGKLECMTAIEKLKGDEPASRLLIAVCCAIGIADGDFDADEKKATREVCDKLGLNSADFSL